MDFPDDNYYYDPDCDISRFLAFPDPPLEEEGLNISSPFDQQLPLMPNPPPPPQPTLDGNTIFSLPPIGSGANTAALLVPSTVQPEPLSAEGVIISAMEAVHIDEPPYEPFFQQLLSGQKDCTRCLTLRQVSHSSPNRILIFAVHGTLATFNHAVFDVEYFNECGQMFNHELFHVDLSLRSHEWVKSFMVGCVTVLQTDATGITKDSLASFYDTLCTDLNIPIEEALGIDFGSTLCFQDTGNNFVQSLPLSSEVGETSRTKDDVPNKNGLNVNLPVGKEPTIMIPNPLVQSPSGSTGASSAASPTLATTNSMPTSGGSSDDPVVVETVGSPDAGRCAPARTPLALQRQRTANMRLPELANYLHLPMAEAARRLKVCSTALKHVCRRNGLARWPSRQIQAIDRQIDKLERDLIRANRRGGLFAIKEEIEALQIKKAAIYEKMLRDN